MSTRTVIASTPGPAPRTRCAARAATALAMVALGVCSCGPGAASRPAFQHYSSAGISFRFPGSWHRSTQLGDPPYFFTSFSEPFVYLSTASFDPLCARGGPTNCPIPISRLGPRGILVVWMVAGRPTRGPIVDHPDARVGGHDARVTTEAVSSWCRAVRGTAQMEADIQLRLPEDELIALACMRGPDIAALTNSVQLMLDSATLSPRA